MPDFSETLLFISCDPSELFNTNGLKAGYFQVEKASRFQRDMVLVTYFRFAESQDQNFCIPSLRNNTFPCITLQLD